MDNLETLFNKKQYDLIAKLTEESSDPKERFLRLSSLVILGKDNEALDEIEAHQSLFDKAYPFKTMRLHFELLFKNNMYDEAKIALKHYQDLPYISQEVEEYLRELPELIENRNKTSQKMIPLDEICDRFESEKDSDLLLEALSYLKVYNIKNMIDSLKVFLTRKEVRQDLRAFALFALMEQDYPNEISFLSLEGVVKVVPKKLKTPFENKDFLDLSKKIEQLSSRNVTLNETATQLCASYVIDTFPSNIYADGIDNLAEAVVSLAKDYIREESSDLKPEILLLKKKIKEVLEAK